MIVRPPAIYLYITALAFSLATGIQLHAQNCVNKFSQLNFNTATYENFTKSIVTANGEIISAGRLFDFNHAGHIAKYSEKGSPLWSYTYRIDFFDFVKSIFFAAAGTSDMVSMPDGGFVMAGCAEQVLPPYGQDAPVKKWGLIARMDRFGKVLWNKTLLANGDLNFTNIYKTSDGDLIAYLAADNGYKRSAGDHSYNRVLRIGPDGTVRWSTYLFTFLFDAGGLGVNNKRAITQTASGNIVIGDVAHKTVAVNGQIKEGNFHFFELDYVTGNINWEASHEYGAPYNTYVPEVVSVKELADGKLSFISTLYHNGSAGYVEQGANIITDNRGNIQNVIAYAPADGSTCQVKEAAIDRNTGNRVLLLYNDDKKILINVDDAGQIVWQQGYNNGQDALPVNCFSAGSNGFNIFTSNNNTKRYGLLITDNTGIIDCAGEPSGIIATAASLDITHDSMRTDPSYRFDEYYDYAHPLKNWSEYSLAKETVCLQTIACCNDIIDTTNATEIHICEGQSYMLTDSTVIQDSGLYYVTYKTYLGCDSVKYYHIIPDKNVNQLSLGKDSCLGTQSNITIRATSGYEKYYWMNRLSPDTSSFYTVTQPGKYAVSVNNTCGSKEVEIQVFDSCEYSIYLPTAFTPNADGKNDVFRIPSMNKNKLLVLNIYNRTGQLVFQTNNASVGWDGTYKNEPLDTGTYFYYTEMEGITGKRLAKKGYVLLLR